MIPSSAARFWQIHATVAARSSFDPGSLISAVVVVAAADFVANSAQCCFAIAAVAANSADFAGSVVKIDSADFGRSCLRFVDSCPSSVAIEAEESGLAFALSVAQSFFELPRDCFSQLRRLSRS